LMYAERIGPSCGPALYVNGAAAGCSQATGGGMGSLIKGWSSPLSWSPLTQMEELWNSAAYFNALTNALLQSYSGTLATLGTDAGRIRFEVHGGFLAPDGGFKTIVTTDHPIRVLEYRTSTEGGVPVRTFVRELLGEIALHTSSDPFGSQALYVGTLEVYTDNHTLVMKPQVWGVVHRSTNSGVFNRSGPFPFLPGLPFIGPHIY
jgi:hypothetical protein